MNKQHFDINKLHVAAPCSVGWETMSGDERVRRCHSCQLNIYNISEMTKTEAENLVANHEGRLCIRLYKRADGTVLTKDCPVGLRAYQKRISRFAGATLAAILGLFSISFGQKENKESDDSQFRITKTINQNQASDLSGIIQDVNGAIISQAVIKLYREGDKKSLKAKSDNKGNYSFKDISTGNYTLEIKYQGYITQKFVNLEIKNSESIKIDVELKYGKIHLVVGMYSAEPSIDSASSNITATITNETIKKIAN